MFRFGVVINLLALSRAREYFQILQVLYLVVFFYPSWCMFKCLSIYMYLTFYKPTYYYNLNIHILVAKLNTMSISILQLCQILFLFYSKATTNAPQTTNFKQTGNIQKNITVTFYHESTEQLRNENDRDGKVLVVTLYGVLLFVVFFCWLCIYFRTQISKCYILIAYCTSCWVWHNVEYYSQ